MEALRPFLSHAFGRLQVIETRRAEDVTRLARDAAQDGERCVLVAGGDGTAHFAANGVVGTETALGLLPVGTGNDLAHAVGLPKSMEAAAHVLAEGHHRAVDVGAVGERVFGCVLGVGFDTDALKRINSHWLPRGPLLYSWGALRTLATYSARRMWITAGDVQLQDEVVFAAVTNTKSYAGGMRISPFAEIDDGALDLCAIRELGLVKTLTSFRRVVQGNHVGMEGVVFAQAPQVRIETEEPMPITLDGELTSIETPIDVRVLPGALRLLGAPVLAPVGVRS